MNWSHTQKSNVWNKGRIVTQEQKDSWRKDACGAWISWSEYGNRNSEYGWEIDHIIASANNGSDNLSNLQPLHWENNEYKADKTTNRYCVIKANGTKNERV